MPVPLLDLRAQFTAVEPDIRAGLETVITDQRFIMGAEVGQLEQAIADFAGVGNAVACASGTDALLLVLKTLDLGPKDEVITTPFTFFATAGAIVNAGGKPRFADIEADSFNLDPDAAADARNARTRAIVPVHLYGRMVDLRALRDAAGDVPILEDAAQAIGSCRRYGTATVGPGQETMAATLSFFPSKNLGAWGDGGMILVNDADLATRLRLLRTHGGAKQYHHEEVGTNSRLDTLQAAVLLAKLPRLQNWNVARRANAAAYRERLSGLSAVRCPDDDHSFDHVYHQFTIRIQRRDQLVEFLRARGIGCAVYYPTPLHLQPCFAALGYQRGQFPEAERAAAEVVSLPVYPELTESQIDEVCDAVREFCGKHG